MAESQRGFEIGDCMRRHIPSLDGLRAVAVGLVLICHLGGPVVPIGAVGVDIFFVLSGFLITGILASEVEATGRLRLGRFYMRRMLRLTPALVLCVALFIGAFSILDGRVPWNVVAVALTYTANYAHAVYDVKLGCLDHFWSLACEEQFYLIWPCIVLGLSRLVSTRPKRAMVLAGFALALALYRYAMSEFHTSDRVYYALDTHMDGLVLGGALASWLPGLEALFVRRPEIARRLSLWMVPVALAVLLLVMQRRQWIYVDGSRYGMAMTALAAAVVIADLVASPVSWLRRVLEHNVLVYIGIISYGLYVYHFPIYYIARLTVGSFGPAVRAPVCILASFAVAMLSYHLVEKRLLAVKKRFD